MLYNLVVGLLRGRYAFFVCFVGYFGICFSSIIGIVGIVGGIVGSIYSLVSSRRFLVLAQFFAEARTLNFAVNSAGIYNSFFAHVACC